MGTKERKCRHLRAVEDRPSDLEAFLVAAVVAVAGVAFAAALVTLRGSAARVEAEAAAMEAAVAVSDGTVSDGAWERVPGDAGDADVPDEAEGASEAVAVLEAMPDGTEAEAVVEGPLDGAEAGANAVTLEDLEREYELGQAYPANGKGTPLISDTTYGRGAGMVDMVTLDRETNVEVRHYGQVEADGTVRWYAAETVVGPDGLPVVMPRN